MISRYKLKPQTTSAIEMQEPRAQASEIALMIDARSFVVDVLAGTATFVLMPEYDGADPQTVIVAVGQVISTSAGQVSVLRREQFYEMYEPDDPVQ